MANTVQHQGSISTICLRSAIAVLASAFVVVPMMIGPQSAHAQTLKVLHAFSGSPDGAEPSTSLRF